MVRINFFALFTVLLFVPQILWATVHRVSYNVATVIDLKDDDEIDLVDFPVGWGYSRIVLGINSVPALQLSGHLVANDCFHELHSYYEEFDFAYTGNEKIVYHGSEQKLPIQWWVDANPVVSSCKSYSEMQRKDSIATMLYNLADSIYSEKIKDYKDLGKLNSETVFEGTSAFFKITHLPDVFYNRIYVQVEPMDGRKLEGAVFSSGKRIDVSEYSSTFVLEQRTALPPTFELAFPEYRKVKLKWWVEVQNPNELEIESRKKTISSDSVEIEYFFGKSLYSNSSVKLVFDRNKFVDRKVPVVKRLSFDPQGPNKSRNLGHRGEIYDFDAKLNPGDSAVIAIPLNFNYQPDSDFVSIEHFIREENRWIEESVDSVVDNYAYAKVGHFSWFKFKHLARFFVGKAVPYLDECAEVSSVCDKILDNVEERAGVVDDVLGMLFESPCNNDNDESRKFIEMMFGLSKKSNWDAGMGRVDGTSIIKMGQDLIEALNDKRNLPLVKLSDPYKDECNESDEMKDICKWQRTRDNLDILLADAILSQLDPKGADVTKRLGVSRYSFDMANDLGILTVGQGVAFDAYIYDDYFMVSSGLIEESASFVSGLKSCYGAANIPGLFARFEGYGDAYRKLSLEEKCKTIYGFTHIIDRIPQWASDVFSCISFENSYKNIFRSHEGRLIALSEAMVRISLLAWLKKADNFRNYTLLRYKAAYDGIRAWLELAGPFLDYNNIVIKAYGSLALYEYVHYGTDDNLKMVNSGLKRHYGENGGYSEGTGYSQYIWEDLTYVLAALKDAYENKSKKLSIEGKFLKSPDYMFEFSRPVGGAGSDGGYRHYGLIPVEIDDGVTYNPDYRVWAKLKDDPKYLAMSEKYPLKGKNNEINVLTVFGFPDTSLYNSKEKVLPNRDSLWGDLKDGIGMITAVNGDDTVALSMIAENGELWTRGQAHDQQDNLSITLTSSKKGFLIQDPGYSGFEKRSTDDHFHRYVDHNVLTTVYGQHDNRKIPTSEVLARVTDFTGELPGTYALEAVAVGSFWVNMGYDFTVEGGEGSSVKGQINEPQNGIVGFTATTKIKQSDGGNKFDNNRSIMYFGGYFWVIDRPDYEGLMWKANSPIDEWSDIKIRLYGSLQNPLDADMDNETDSKILQNGNRSDYEPTDNGDYYLRNYKYTATDADAKTYVMNYALRDDSFAKESVDCPNDYQCFMNSDKTLRVIVPPAEENFKLCDALPYGECFGEARSSGITIFKKVKPGEWTTRWVLDGELYAMEQNNKVPLTSATVTWSSFLYEKEDGTFMRDRFKGTYLPAIPILLLR